MFVDLTDQPWKVLTIPERDFFIGMLEIGYPQSITPVASIAKPNDQTARTAFRDIDLPWHRDGIESQAIKDMQGGTYIEAPNVDLVGMYCLRDNAVNGEHQPCYTQLAEAEPDADPYDDSQFTLVAEVDLRPGEALLWDNRLWHRRHGKVGDRILIRYWTTLYDRSILVP